MIPFETLLALVVFVFASSVTPGPNNLMLTASGINYGFVRTIPHMLGIPGGVMLLCLLVAFGLGAIFNSYPLLQETLKWLGCAYLLYLSWCIARATPIANQAEGVSSESKPFTFLQSVSFQFVNPKAWVMVISAMSSFTLTGEDYVASALLVTLVFAIVNLPSISLWAGFGSVLRKLMTDPRKLRVINLALAGLTAGSVLLIIG
ncbi:LysE family translocator [Aestuariirhabdus sp. Z084]|uniref:LysE family translocator n=1 Tax=Aestuariirhabdus haliotis TaxID=2918751 RepID=UPI00201B44B5|nr:LysE family translocator [Aestuariirhabdus haliotis]MCL6417722.1 LysE family translocator [Aestuariirhabdus haliotis]MCL6421673.1 LysE family translocator [Aestuariirhabdus haliotis]